MFVKKFCRFTYNHLFLFIFLLFVTYIYRSFPLLFSLFISSFPVIACTALLLGLLLSFGNPNFTENEANNNHVSETLPLLSGVSESATNFIDYRDNSFTSNKFISNRKNFSRKSSEDVRIEGRHIDFSGNVPLIVKKPDDIDDKDEDKDIREDGTRFNGGEYVQLNDDTEDLDSKLEASSPTASLHTHGGNLLHSTSGYLESVGAHEADTDSASSKASIGNAVPILDELHPLLDLKSPPPQEDFNGKCFRNSEGEALDNIENEEKEGEEDDDEEEDSNDGEEEEEEEDAHHDKENDMKPRIPWTEDDQKNVMDLGTSELERNQRLENLIARRRLRKQNIRLMAERNLIDLESTDLNFPVAAISTGKRNPFDLPYDSLDDTEFDVIPGSAPSVLLPRRNPFDIPYDSNEEKPDLKGDAAFHNDTASFHPKDTFFRRYESFTTTRPSAYTGNPLPEKGELKPKAVFPEGSMYFQGGNHSSCEKIISQVRDPKLPLVQEIESSGSDTDTEDEAGVVKNFSEETEMVSGPQHEFDIEHEIRRSEVDYECEEDAGQIGDSDLAFSEPDTPGFIVESAVSSPKEVCEPVAGEEKKGFSVVSIGNDAFDSQARIPQLLDDLGHHHVQTLSDIGHAIREPVYDLSPTSTVNRNLISSTTTSESRPGPTTDAFVGQDNDEDVPSGRETIFEPSQSFNSVNSEASEKRFYTDMSNMVDDNGTFSNEGDNISSSYTEILCQDATEPDATPPDLDKELSFAELDENSITKGEIYSSNSAMETDILDGQRQLFSDQYLCKPENGHPAKHTAIIGPEFSSPVPQEGDEGDRLMDLNTAPSETQKPVVGPTIECPPMEAAVFSEDVRSAPLLSINGGDEAETAAMADKPASPSPPVEDSTGLLDR